MTIANLTLYRPEATDLVRRAVELAHRDRSSKPVSIRATDELGNATTWFKVYPRGKRGSDWVNLLTFDATTKPKARDAIASNWEHYAWSLCK